MPETGTGPGANATTGAEPRERLSQRGALVLRRKDDGTWLVVRKEVTPLAPRPHPSQPA